MNAASASPLVPISLQINDHRRDIVGLRYVYPVVSRRAGGVSVGINLNPNNACNWRCVYCQVPDLVRGAAPLLDLNLLEEELAYLLDELLYGDFMQRAVPESARRINDIALSGNGEPTSSGQFIQVIAIVERQLRRTGLLHKLKFVLISNGSQMYKPAVQAGLALMQKLGGELWFKFDRAPVQGFSEVNQIALTPVQLKRRLQAASNLCPTWIQTCMFATDGQLPSSDEIDNWLALLEEAVMEGARVEGVLLYGLARASTQPEAPRLSAAPSEWMQALAQRIEDRGLQVKLSL